MKSSALFYQFGALCLAVFLVAGHGELRGQPSADTPPAKSSNLDDLSQAELLKSYLQVRDQLHATQLAIANSRAETEANARAQATAISEKLEAIKSAMEAERQRTQVESLRANAERSESILARIPAGRWGAPEDLQGAVLLLASDAGRYMHGAIIPVDGGWLAR